MNIKIGKYQLNQSVNNGGFDLVENIERINKDSKEKYAARKLLGYDMRLETCINTIVANNLKEKESTVELKEFLEAYKKEKEAISKMLKQ